ncbi:hypothetical protein KRX56_02235 [Dermabacteraceae bacterium TAE3-ERU27]|nr:hypothetical protein [Dermabacteraceae bacterium TAE3-ERU27]
MNHRLQVPEAISAEDVELLVLNRYPRAEKDEDGTLRITRHSRLVPGEKAGEWIVETLTERNPETAGADEDRRGFVRAFPEGAPWREEGRILDLVHAIARRTGGELITDNDVRLSPHRYSVPDLHIVAGEQLQGQDALELVRTLTPTVELKEDGERYLLSVTIGKGGHVEVEVGAGDSVPSALLSVDWVREGFVSYRVTYVPDDEVELVTEKPDRATVQRWREAFYACGAIAHVLHEEVGGYVLDGDEFLVDPADLS